MGLNGAALRAFEKEVARQQAEGVPLRDQILWRLGELTNAQEVDLVEHASHFPELYTGFSAGGLQTGFVGGEEGSIGSLEDGGSLVLTGFLHDPGSRTLVAKFKRRLLLEQELALHELLEVEPELRGRGISLRFLRRSFGLYDELGLQEVHLQAGMGTGRWLWARVGFEFTLPVDCERVRGWATKVCGALGIDELNVGSYASAAQFARMGGNRMVSMAQLAEVMPAEAERFRLRAEANELGMDERIELGRAVMLSGPDWNGRLALAGPSRLAFEIYTDAKEERLRQDPH